MSAMIAKSMMGSLAKSGLVDNLLNKSKELLKSESHPTVVDSGSPPEIGSVIPEKMTVEMIKREQDNISRSICNNINATFLKKGDEFVDVVKLIISKEFDNANEDSMKELVSSKINDVLDKAVSKIADDIAQGGNFVERIEGLIQKQVGEILSRELDESIQKTIEGIHKSGDKKVIEFCKNRGIPESNAPGTGQNSGDNNNTIVSSPFEEEKQNTGGRKTARTRSMRNRGFKKSKTTKLRRTRKRPRFNSSRRSIIR
jgi:hypothetical protein